MSTPQKEHSPEELPSATEALLREVLQRLPTEPDDKPQEFIIHLHGTNLLQLAEDILFLQAHGHTASTLTVARAMLESLFKLGVAVANPSLAALKTLLEVEWGEIQTAMPGSLYKELDGIRKKLEYSEIGQRMEKLSKRWGLPEKEYLNHKKFSIHGWAKKAGLAHLYKYRYADLSNYSHANAHSFVLGSAPAYVLAVVTLCLLEAARRIVAGSGAIFPAGLREATASLWSLFQSYHKEGVYCALFARDAMRVPTPRPQPPEKRFMSN